jgi:hypothetical protein
MFVYVCMYVCRIHAPPCTHARVCMHIVFHISCRYMCSFWCHFPSHYVWLKLRQLWPISTWPTHVHTSAPKKHVSSFLSRTSRVHARIPTYLLMHFIPMRQCAQSRLTWGYETSLLTAHFVHSAEGTARAARRGQNCSQNVVSFASGNLWTFCKVCGVPCHACTVAWSHMLIMIYLAWLLPTEKIMRTHGLASPLNGRFAWEAQRRNILLYFCGYHDMHVIHVCYYFVFGCCSNFWGKDCLSVRIFCVCTWSADIHQTHIWTLVYVQSGRQACVVKGSWWLGRTYEGDPFVCMPACMYVYACMCVSYVYFLKKSNSISSLLWHVTDSL